MKNPLSYWRKPSLPITVSTRSTAPFLPMPAAFDTLIEDFYQEAFNLATSSFDNWEGLMISPSVDVLEDTNEFKIEVEMPGMGPDDVKLSIEDHKLTIKGDKTSARTDQNQNYVKREIAYGAYQRTVMLPDSVDASQATASFRKGMLWVTLPKRPGSSKRSKEIEIEQK